MGKHSPKQQVEHGIDNVLLFLAGVSTGMFALAVAYSYHPGIADWSSRIIIGTTIGITGAVLIALVAIQIVHRRKG